MGAGNRRRRTLGVNRWSANVLAATLLGALGAFEDCPRRDFDACRSPERLTNPASIPRQREPQHVRRHTARIDRYF